MTKWLIIVSCMGLLIPDIFGQAELNTNVIPPSPNSASLAKFGDIPVSYYTGRPQIEIPIFTLTQGLLSAPISLNYHGGGIRVEEIASWVGLGWSLNAGGVISRTKRELADELPAYGFWDAAEIPPNTIDNYNKYLEFLTGTVDSQCDIFQFSTPQGSGKFYIDKNDNIQIVPQQKIKIEKTQGWVSGIGTESGTIQQWKITTAEGTKYYFDDYETSEPVSYSNNGTFPVIRNERYISSWYLSKIVSVNNQDTIFFEYDSYPLNYNYQVSQTGYPISQVHTRIYLVGKRLSKIRSKGYTINFNAGGYRRDYSGDKVLESVEIFNQENSLLKRFHFSYSYFTPSGTTVFDLNYTPQSGHGGISQHDTEKRLKLELVYESNNEGSMPPYIFEYESSVFLPDRFSYAVDHWGFFNGRTSNTSLLSKVKEIRVVNDVETLVVHEGANREANPSTVTAGVLKRIQYPTGGYIDFHFEPNEAYENRLPNETVTLTNSFDQMPPFSYQVQYGSNFTIHSSDFTELTILPIQVYFQDTANCMVNVKIRRVSTNEMVYSHWFKTSDMMQAKKINLKSGTYQPEHVVNSQNCLGETYYFQLSYADEIPTANKKVGGVRIKKIVSTMDHPADTVVRHYQYYADGDYDISGKRITSGRLVTMPEYGYYLMNDIGVLEFKRGSTTNIPLGTTQGSHIGYKEVREYMYQDGTKQQETVYQFTSAEDYPDEINMSYIHDVGVSVTPVPTNPATSFGYTFTSTVNLDYPFPPVDSYDWKRGLLTQKMDIKVHGEIIEPLKRTINSYNFIHHQPKVKGVKITSGMSDGAHDILRLKYFDTSTGRAELTSTSEILFDENLEQSTTVMTQYEYDPELYLPIRIRRTNSDGREMLTVKKYVNQYYFGGSDQLLNSQQKLVNSHMFAFPLEEQHWMKNSNDSLLVSGTITVFDTIALNPAAVYLLESSSGIGQPGNEQRIANQYSTLISDQNYAKRVDRKFDTAGKLIEEYLSDNIKVTYKWGYNNSLPVAKVINAASTEIFYTSFEDYSGTNGISPTGVKYYSGSSYSIPVPERPMGSNLVMTYWYYDGSWKFQGEVAYNPFISKPGATGYDEIRVYPQGSQVTTYTYSPGFGISSISDANNVSTYYEYDSFGRLKCIKDDKGNLLTDYYYNYKKTVE